MARLRDRDAWIEVRRLRALLTVICRLSTARRFLAPSFVRLCLTTFALCAMAGGVARAQSSLEPWLELSADGRWDDYIPGGGEGYVARLAPGAGIRLHT